MSLITKDNIKNAHANDNEDSEEYFRWFDSANSGWKIDWDKMFKDVNWKQFVDSLVVPNGNDLFKGYKSANIDVETSGYWSPSVEGSWNIS